jgi:integrase
MALGKQAKILTRNQTDMIVRHIRTRRNGLRNQTIFLLSARAGLRAGEIASLKWLMVLGADGVVGNYLYLPDSAAKGKSGRVIPLNLQLKHSLVELFEHVTENHAFCDPEDFIIQTERAKQTSPQVIVNMFHGWYRQFGLIGCSSHSGRRTFITNAARKISTVGGSLRDVQQLAGHTSLQTTQRYIEGNSDAARLIVNII